MQLARHGNIRARLSSHASSLAVNHSRPCYNAIICCYSNDSSINPLEQLRATKDVRERARLMQDLTQRWSQAAEAYQPSPVEECLSKELGVWKQTVMQVAVSNPDLVTYDVDTQVRPTIKALKAANIAPEDIWFLITKRASLLQQPTCVQRWMDFLIVYGLSPQNLHNFLLRSTDEVLTNTTLFAAGQVVNFLKSLGLKDEFLAQRVLSLWPAVLSRDVEAQLRPITQYLMSLGIEVSDLRGMVCAWPELLLCDVDTQLKPWVHYLRTTMGCTTVQVAEVITACPHLLGFSAESVFRSRVSSLQELGMTQEDMTKMAAQSTRWLLSPGGINPQLDFLTHTAGFTQSEVRQLLLAAPCLLAEKEFELQRKWEWITGVLQCSRQQVLQCPQVLALGLMQTLGPRHGFLDKQGQLHRIMASETDTDVDLTSLCEPSDDVDWCQKMSLSPLDYSKYRAHWEEEYTQGLVRDAAKEFQDELKKLGIYEGTD